MMAEGNRAKTEAAPLVAILAADHDFHDELPRVFPVFPGARDAFGDDDQRAHAAGFNAALQIGYFLVGIRAAGLAAGPMAGFDADAVSRRFFPDGRHRPARGQHRPADRRLVPPAAPALGLRRRRHHRLTATLIAPYSRTVPDGTVLGPPASVRTAEPRTTTPGSKVQSPLTVSPRACFSDGASSGMRCSKAAIVL